MRAGVRRRANVPSILVKSLAGELRTPIGRGLSCRVRNKVHTFAVLSSASLHGARASGRVSRGRVSGGWGLTIRAEPCRVATSLMS